jgi:hypothetical protein
VKGRAHAVVVTVGLALLAGCNAIFEIRAGRPRTGCEDLFTIDDMEDGDGKICETEASDRKGSWYVTGDGTGTVMPEPGKPFVPTQIPDGPNGRDGSFYAARMSGSGFHTAGARMGLNLNVVGLGLKPYNAGTIAGITFWLKSNAPITVELPIPATIPTREGAGSCEDADSEHNCGNHFRFTIAAPEPDRWVQYRVPFSALTQSPQLDATGSTVFGSASFNRGELVGVQFLASQTSFDVWVDDIAFYATCTAADCVPTCTEPARPMSCPATGRVAAGCWPEGADCDAVPILANGFHGLWGSGPGDLWIVGGSPHDPGSTVVRWNGSAWSATPKVTPAFLLGIWGSGPGDVWAVGDQGTIVHATGAGWTPVSSGTVTKKSLQSVWGSGPADVWAVGRGGTILRWDGSVWKAVPSGTSQSLYAVAGTGPGDVWAVGLSEATGAGVIVHGDGVSWKAVSGGGAGSWVGVWAAAPDDAWAVGAAPAGGEYVAGSVHWNGTKWSPVAVGAAPPPVILWGVWGSGPGDVWAVGDLGSAFHWQGDAWTAVPTGTRQRLVRVWGTGPDDVWAVGEVGTILRWNGKVWDAVPPEAIEVLQPP